MIYSIYVVYFKTEAYSYVLLPSSTMRMNYHCSSELKN
jgi:hypothetical protein